jgi:hypothetical protein
MPILPSRAGALQELARRLGSERDAERDAAAARLRLLGERALPVLLRALREGARAARLAALQALDGVPPRRALPHVAALAADPEPELAGAAIRWIAANAGAPGVSALASAAGHAAPEVALAAVAALGPLAAAGAPEALDALLGVLLDEARPGALRLAAFEAMPGLGARERRGVLGRLRGTRSRALAARVEGLLARPGPSKPDDLAAVHRGLAESSDPAQLGRLLDAVARERSPASLPVLRRLLDRIGAPKDAGRAHAELAGRIHGLLAAMGSRIALYDLRERLALRPVPAAAALLDAAARVGDASLVPALAALATDAPRLLPDCARAFGAIAAREKLRPRSAALRAVRPEHRAALGVLWGRRGRSA